MMDVGVRRSSIVKVAEYVAGVGVEGKFTKLELMAAVPGVAQADRRMRDLREMGWVIDNYKVNPSLSPNEYLIRKIGTRVDLGQRATVAARKSVGGPKRRRIFDRDGYACQVCFTAGGAVYEDMPSRVATLTIGHIIPIARGGNDDDDNLRTECQRCNDEARDLTAPPPDMVEVMTRASAVGGRKEKQELFLWMQRGQRTLTNKERVFNDWARLPLEQRVQVLMDLASQVVMDEEPPPREP
jgi:hypothetical protein